MELINSKRLVYTASYVSTQLTEDEQKGAEKKPGDAYRKANLMRALDLKSEDIDRIRTTLADRGACGGTAKRDDLEKMLWMAQKLTNKERPVSNMELATAMAPISYDMITELMGFSSAVRLKGELYFHLVKLQKKISPIGRLHLERIEMYPAGGELVFTVPMAPGETVTISHKEWSTSSSEFEEIVQDYFESFSERGVAEKTDSAMSSESESKHSSAINFGASLSGTYAGVTLTTTLGLASTTDERESVKNAMQKNREVTEKASARTRKEHKVSMKIETKSGTEDVSGKTITNNATAPIRIDYYRMMRKWRTDLYRYGLRQTYDIVIPLPGARLWAYHQRVAEIDKQLRTPLQFPLKPGELDKDNYAAEALKLGVVVEGPPPETMTDRKYGGFDFLSESDASHQHYDKIEFDVPQGYMLSPNPADLTWKADLAVWPNHGDFYIQVIDAPGTDPGNDHTQTATLPKLAGGTGHWAVIFKHYYISAVSMTVNLTYKRLDEAMRTWQTSTWNQLRAAAEARYQEDLRRLQDERDRLWRLLNGKDTLSLRRLEREELLRLVMQWLLGPGFGVASSDYGLEGTLRRLLSNEEDFRDTKMVRLDGLIPLPPPISPTFDGISPSEWEKAILFGDQVKFIHQAIEWENLLYFLYPYFWGSENVGHGKLLFEHSDSEHERFLRAGYARIVLTVRPGFEKDFASFMANGALSEISDAPYVTVSEEITSFARTNYSGIPPANPELHARPLLYPEQRATWDTMQALFKEIDAYKAKTTKYPDKLSDLTTTVPIVDAWGNPFVYRMPGLGADYDLVSLGADNKVGGEGLSADISSAAGASLVATWFDYTPTSALDIVMDTKPEDIA